MNTQESYEPGFDLNRQDLEPDSCAEEDPESEGYAKGFWLRLMAFSCSLNAMRVRVLETAYGCARGRKL